MRRILIISLALIASGMLLSASAHASAPSVVLDDPADGALITGGQPNLVGQATGGPTVSDQVTVNVYSGTSTSGTLVEKLQSQVVNGSFGGAAAGLADGTYTAQATESDASGNLGTSQPVTFQLFTGTPQLTLTAPSPPITTSAPTFTGTALTASGDASTAYLVIYPGRSTDATPVAVVPGSVAADGSFTIQVLPGLAAGTYTAVASQVLSDGSTTFSATSTFSVSNATALAVSSPAAGASEPQTGVVFSGVAGDGYGDAAALKLTLHRGATASGKTVGTESVTRSGASWSERWPTTLALGTYTLTVTQTNVVNAPTTVTRTFKVAPPGSVTGRVTISATGKLSAKLSCLTGAGTCSGDVLIVTRSSFQPLAGGPTGPLSLMFARYNVAAARSATLTARLSARQLRILRRARTNTLTVTVVYSVGTKLTSSSRETTAVGVG